MTALAVAVALTVIALTAVLANAVAPSPTGLVATPNVALGGQVDLTWNANGGTLFEVDVMDGATVVQTASVDTPSYSVTGLTDGVTYDFEVWGVDASGTLSAEPATASATPSHDTQAPVTTSDAKATYNDTAKITFTATDTPAGAGVANTFFRLDGGALTTGTVCNTSVLGAHTVEFLSVDKAVPANTEATKTANFTVADTIAPDTISDVAAVYFDSATVGIWAEDNEGGSGLATLSYKLDAASTVTTSAASTSVTANQAGEHTLLFWSTDVAGNKEATVTATFTVIDTVAPVTTSDAASDPYDGTATIHFTATDGSGSGIAATYYSLDGADFATGTSVTTSAYGDHTVDFYSVDNEGNTEEANTATFSVVDKTLPLTISDVAASYLNTAVIHLTATDVTGIDTIRYSIDGGSVIVVSSRGALVTPSIVRGTPAPAGHYASGNAGDPGTTCGTCHTITDPPPPNETPTSKTCTITVSVAGAHTLAFSSVDKAGNVEATKTAPFTITDTIAPTTTSDAKASYETAAAIHLSATDNGGGSGIAATFFTLDGGAPQTGTTINVTAKGTHTITFWSQDNDGNVEADKTATFAVGDFSAPRTVSDVSAAYDNVAVIHLAATDSGGVKEIHYILDDGTPQVFSRSALAAPPALDTGTPAPAGHFGTGNAGDPGTNCGTCHVINPPVEPPPPGGSTTREATVTCSVAGSHTLKFWAVDMDGNVEATKTAFFTVSDTIPPVTTSDAVATYSSAAHITLSATDNAGGSGVAATFYVLDGADLTQGTTVDVTAAGSHTLVFFSTDNDGNTEAEQTATFTIGEEEGDTTAPVTTSDAQATYDAAPAVITLTATDAESGVEEIHYTLDGGSETVAAMPGAPDLPTTAVGPTGHFMTGPVSASCGGCHNLLTTAAPDVASGTAAPAGHQYTGVAGTEAKCADCHTITGDEEPPPLPNTKTATVTVTTEGEHTLTFFAVDGAGNTEAAHTVTFTIGGAPPVVTVERCYGDDRFATSAESCADTFADGSSDSVVLATGMNFADALSGSGLAGALDAPLLLTKQGAIPDVVMAEIERVTEGHAATIYIVGGTAAISADVEDTLDADFDVVRLAGSDRYETAADVADEIEWISGVSTVFVARGDTFPDALALGPFAYAEGIPVLLTAPTALPDATAAALESLTPEDAVIAGSASAVSDAVKAEVDTLVGTVTRVGGTDRFDTAVKVAEYGVAQGWGDFGFVGVANGLNFPDALSGGAACGANGGVLVLTDPATLSGATDAFLDAHVSDVESVVVYGSSAAVSTDVYNDIDDKF